MNKTNFEINSTKRIVPFTTKFYRLDSSRASKNSSRSGSRRVFKKVNNCFSFKKNRFLNRRPLNRPRSLNRHLDNFFVFFFFVDFVEYSLVDLVFWEIFRLEIVFIETNIMHSDNSSYLVHPDQIYITVNTFITIIFIYLDRRHHLIYSKTNFLVLNIYIYSTTKCI